MAGANNVCVWDAFGDFSCKAPAREINPFEGSGASIEYFADGSVGPSPSGPGGQKNAALAKKPAGVAEAFTDALKKVSPKGLPPPAPVVPGPVGAEGFCGCASVPQ